MFVLKQRRKPQAMIGRIQIIRHEPVPKCGSYEVMRSRRSPMKNALYSLAELHEPDPPCPTRRSMRLRASTNLVPMRLQQRFTTRCRLVPNRSDWMSSGDFCDIANQPLMPSRPEEFHGVSLTGRVAGRAS